jgi:RimJ/RimL family protein N-acetyltransferase
VLEEGRDGEFFRWLGAEADMNPPLACVVVDDEVTGWIDYDVARPWLEEGEVNIGYFVLAPYRRKGYATRALELLIAYLGDETDCQVATLLIDTRNERSLAVARRAGFTQVDDIGTGSFYFKQIVQQSQSGGGDPE